LRGYRQGVRRAVKRPPTRLTSQLPHIAAWGEPYTKGAAASSMPNL
jgi:hypothetical protein